MRDRIRHILRKLIREPLFHFLLAGFVLFAAAEHHRRAQDQYRIAVTPELVAQLKSAYELEFGTPPPEKAVPGLIDDYVAAEVLYREGLARGLDEGDEIVRRRIIQKVAFLEQDMAVPDEPGEQELRAWFADNRERYEKSGNLDFTHVFFAADPGQEEGARQRAQAVLAGLSPSVPRAPERGDAFPDLYDFSGFGPQEARRLFGESEMAQALFQASSGRWAGPFRSAFGWHLVRVSRSEPAGTLSYAEAREQVRADWLEAAREKANARRLAELRRRYTVVRED